MVTSNRWTVLAIIFAARTSMGYQFQSVGSVGPVLVEHLAIDFAMLGTLIGMYKLPGAFLAYPAGLLGRRLGLKPIAALGLALMAIGGAITAYADALALATAGRVLAGAGAVLFNVLSAAIVANWFIDKEMTLAMAIHVNSWPSGIALGLVTQAMCAAVPWVTEKRGTSHSRPPEDRLEARGLQRREPVPTNHTSGVSNRRMRDTESKCLVNRYRRRRLSLFRPRFSSRRSYLPVKK